MLTEKKNLFSSTWILCEFRPSYLAEPKKEKKVVKGHPIPPNLYYKILYYVIYFLVSTKKLLSKGRKLN